MYCCSGRLFCARTAMEARSSSPRRCWGVCFKRRTGSEDSTLEHNNGIVDDVRVLYGVYHVELSSTMLCELWGRSKTPPSSREHARVLLAAASTRCLGSVGSVPSASFFFKQQQTLLVALSPPSACVRISRRLSAFARMRKVYGRRG